MTDVTHIIFPNSGAHVPCTRKENPRELPCIVCETIEKTIFIVETICITSPLGHSPFNSISANPSAESCCCGSCMLHHSPGLQRVVLSLSCFKGTVSWQESVSITDMILCSLEILFTTYFWRKYIGPNLAWIPKESYLELHGLRYVYFPEVANVSSEW